MTGEDYTDYIEVDGDEFSNEFPVDDDRGHDHDDDENNDSLVHSRLDNNEDNYDEVLQLTEYNDGMLTALDRPGGLSAEYVDIDVGSIDAKYEKQAKKFVGKITKFILDFNDIELSDKHKSYISEVGQLQMSNLKDMLILVDMNKQMLDNIVRRINFSQAEDYAMINTYNQLMNQHIKLMKELQNTYKQIPSTIKRMRADVLLTESSNQNDKPEKDNDVYTEEYGDKQFNNNKDLLRKLREEYINKNKDGLHASNITDTGSVGMA